MVTKVAEGEQKTQGKEGVTWEMRGRETARKRKGKERVGSWGKEGEMGDNFFVMNKFTLIYRSRDQKDAF